MQLAAAGVVAARLATCLRAAAAVGGGGLGWAVAAAQPGRCSAAQHAMARWQQAGGWGTGRRWRECLEGKHRLGRRPRRLERLQLQSAAASVWPDQAGCMRALPPPPTVLSREAALPSGEQGIAEAVARALTHTMPASLCAH